MIPLSLITDNSTTAAHLTITEEVCSYPLGLRLYLYLSLWFLTPVLLFSKNPLRLLVPLKDTYMKEKKN